MKILCSLLFVLFLSIPSRAQTDAHSLVQEGVALNDEGRYDEAIAKFDKALKLEPGNCEALYEKSYTLMVTKKYEESTTLLKSILRDCKGEDLRMRSFANYGTILDMTGEGKKSIKIYNEGIKEFPDKYLLYFNRGVTEAGLGQTDDAILSFESSLQRNPYHASSHNALARMMGPQRRIQALLSVFSFLLIEPEGNRAKANVQYLNQLVFKGVERKDDKNVTINIDAAMLDKKKKPKEDDFSSAELMFSLLSASNEIPDSLGAKNEADRLSYRLQTLVSVIGESSSGKEKGFFKTFYVPMFRDMKERNLVSTACYIALSASGDESLQEWARNNKFEISKFYDWFNNYDWPK